MLSCWMGMGQYRIAIVVFPPNQKFLMFYLTNNITIFHYGVLKYLSYTQVFSPKLKQKADSFVNTVNICRKNLSVRRENVAGQAWFQFEHKLI